MKQEKIIITGATGFIGGFIVEEALRREMEVYCIVRKTSDLSRINRQGVHFLHFHPDDPNQLEREMDGFVKQFGQPDYFVHNAGITKASNNADFTRINAQHTAHYAQQSRRHFYGLKRFVLMSSLAGQGPGNPDTLAPIRVDHRPAPDTFYGKSKLLAENMLKEVENIPYVILRPTGVYGPYDHDYLLYLKTLLMGIEPVMGFREQHLSFVYVTDLVKSIFLALEQPVEKETFIISDGDNYTGTEYGILARRALGCKALKLRIPLPVVKAATTITEQIGKIVGDVPTLNRDKYLTMKAINWKADIEYTIRRLNYRPAVSLEEGLRLCVEWYRKNGWI